jgi:hypothetical protein
MSIQDQHETVGNGATANATNAKFRSRTSGAPKGSKNAMKHGYYSLVKLVQSRHGMLDRRTILGKMVVETMRRLEADLGGDLSTAQKMLVQDVAIDTLILQALQTKLNVQPIRKGKVHPVFPLRAQLVSQRREHLKLLGIHRVAKVASLHEILAQPDQPEPPKESDKNQAEE